MSTVNKERKRGTIGVPRGTKRGPYKKKIKEDGEGKKGRGRPKGSYETKVCEECGETFSAGAKTAKHKSYENHVLDHKTEQFSCECPDAPKLILNTLELNVSGRNPLTEKLDKYMNFKEVKQHMLVEHMGWHGCHQCFRVFQTNKALVEHIETHNQTHMCNICGSTCKTRDAMKYHMATQHSDDNGENNDQKSGENNGENNGQNNGKNNGENNGEKKLTKRERYMKKGRKTTELCPDCGQDVELRQKTKHKLIHTIENFTCECPDLPQVFKLPEQLGFQKRVGSGFYERERHVKEKHMGWLGCSDCLRSFETKMKLTQHMLTHKKVCDLCGHEAKNVSVLKVHIDRHHDTNPVECDECGEMQINKYNLTKHKTRNHTKHTCTICGAEVKKIREHMKQQHLDEASLRFKCEYCNKGFVWKALMEKHRMNVHIRAQPHKCRYGCDNAYNDASNRAAHERRVHGASFSSPKKHEDGRKNGKSDHYL